MWLRAICAALLAIIIAAHGAPGRGEKKPDARKWGQAINEQMISIATDKDRFAPGDRIVLSVLYRNAGNRDVHVADIWGGSRYTYDVRRAGKRVPLTQFGEVYGDLPAGSAGGDLGAGQQVGFSINLGRILDFTLAGRYTIIVKKPMFPRDPKTPVLTSNEVVIEVDERLAKREHNEEDFGGRRFPPRVTEKGGKKREGKGVGSL
jgi:hypothetical protein